MVVCENKEIEKSVAAGVSCIAVPIEIFEPCKGEACITAYSCCIEAAERFYNLYRGRLLDREAMEYLEKEFSPIAKNMGYKREMNENELMLEYIFEPCMQAPNVSRDIKTHKISSNAVLAKLCEASGCDIEIADDGDDVIFAVVNDGKLSAYAGMNDVIYSDNSIEISVETACDHRRKGYGTACVLALLNHLVSKGITVRYKCSVDNSASSALAEKCGFVLEGKRFSFVCEKI